MTEWKQRRIGDLGKVVTGKTPPTESTEYFDGDELFISPKDLSRDSYYVTETETHVSEKALEKFRGQVIPRDAVMFTSLSFAFGKMGLASRRCMTNQQINSVVVSGDHEAKFVYYLLRAYESIIFSYNSGIDTPIVPKSVFESIPVLLPLKEEQRKIAAVLSAYDDLIANNQRRIGLLETLAEEIYREWFVRMRFQGGGPRDQRHGLPGGWKLLPFSDVVEIDPAEHVAKSDAATFVPMDHLSTRSMYFVAEGKRRGATGSKFRNGDTLLPRITPSLENGKRGYVTCLADGEVGVGSTEFIVLRERLISKEHAYFLSITNELRKHAELSMTGASGRQRVQEDCFKFFLVAVPPEASSKKFTQTVGPMFEQIANLSRQLGKLAEMRDALLPRLISGRLKVDHLDIHMTPSMQAIASA